MYSGRMVRNLSRSNGCDQTIQDSWPENCRTHKQFGKGEKSVLAVPTPPIKNRISWGPVLPSWWTNFYSDYFLIGTVLFPVPLKSIESFILIFF
jgi:hypothetical protein